MFPAFWGNQERSKKTRDRRRFRPRESNVPELPVLGYEDRGLLSDCNHMHC